jgi:hypothetical protein
LLKKYREKLFSLLPKDVVNDYNAFHLFMCPRGVAGMHRDRNDYVSFLFPISVESGKKGALELGGLGVAFKWEVGDVVILDSQTLQHGTREYEGDLNDRMIGIFIIHQSYLRKNGVEKEKLKDIRNREDKEDKDISIPKSAGQLKRKR